MRHSLGLMLALAVLCASCATMGRPKGRKGGGGTKKTSSGCNCPTFGQIENHMDEYSLSPSAPMAGGHISYSYPAKDGLRAVLSCFPPYKVEWRKSQPHAGEESGEVRSLIPNS